ncbi:hypothetical protein, partial [Klebsiella pneumoniae]|uniref:hypothetical protein n=1 Tax=Klebsiella pneumoniae TaxID=573 RepID=UPI001C70373D
QRPGCQKACVLPENPASYRVVRTKSYLFNKAARHMIRQNPERFEVMLQGFPSYFFDVFKTITAP